MRFDPSMTVLSEETEKYAHVTFFFNGGVEKQFSGEERHMVPSPKVATYDLDPKMNAHGVADKVADILKRGEDQFVMCNFAPPDMVNTFWYNPILSPSQLSYFFRLDTLVFLMQLWWQ